MGKTSDRITCNSKAVTGGSSLKAPSNFCDALFGKDEETKIHDCGNIGVISLCGFCTKECYLIIFTWWACRDCCAQYACNL